MPSPAEVISGCRSCGSNGLELVLDLGLMPLSDGLVQRGFDRTEEERYPLTLVWCPTCSLVQILETVDPTTLFGSDYPYYSSFSPALVEHARANVEGIIQRTGVDEQALVVELASNDGYLLQWFQKEGIPVLGIDPAPGPVASAREKGIDTICDFFTPELARQLVREGKRADVIVGNNVLAHVPDQNLFVAAIADLLSENGTVVMEFPYVKDMIDHCEFDTIYHEHHCYFSLTAAIALFRRQGLEIVSVDRLPIHGGSLRIYASRDGQPDDSVEALLAEERASGLLEATYYQGFSRRAARIRDDLRHLLNDQKRTGARIAAYGAAAKGAILLNFCGVDESVIEYVVDRNSHKHGWEMPGVAIPIDAPERLRRDIPDLLLILAWNFKDEIIEQQAWFADQGGRFIVPIPEPSLV